MRAGHFGKTWLFTIFPHENGCKGHHIEKHGMSSEFSLKSLETRSFSNTNFTDLHEYIVGCVSKKPQRAYV
jgi:hypothetical protein